MIDMKCTFCQNAINPRIPDWGYMFDEDKVSYAHMVCLRHEIEMDRLETEEYLLENITW